MRFWTAFLAAVLTLLVLTQQTRAGGGPECIRRNGPGGLAMLMTQYADAIQQHRDGAAVANWASISAELDAVAAQRDAWASGLYWYTDLDQAKAAAQREGRPIVSLRLLGRLDAELSCANSRFFRTTLYPAAEVSKRMRENFILHWSSERPAPVVTIDYGDGRKLQRTVTGNSAHYMMTGDGTVVDVLPGLYGAKPFAAWLDDAGGFARRASDLSPSDRPTSIRAYHIAKRADVAARWAADQRKLDVRSADRSTKGATLQDRWMGSPTDVKAGGKRPARPVPAARAGKLAISKSFVEAPVVQLVGAPDPADADDAMWSAVAGLHAADATLAPAAIALIRSKRPAGGVENVLPSLLRAIAMDTVRNEYTLHQQVHGWFADGALPTEFEALNQRVYAELFLTPRSDPWLGLAPTNVWSALDDDGFTPTVSAAAR